MRALWRRKIRIGRSSGISTVIGAIFFVIITLLITTNIFLWSIAQHTQYNQAVIQSNQMDADRINERITITSGNYSIVPSPSYLVKVNATLTNEGPVSSQIITLWVVDNNISSYNYVSLRSSNINLDPGDECRVNTSVTIPGCDRTHNYDIWFVTARGNLVSFEKKHYITVINIVEALGPIQIKFNSIKWRSIADGSSGTYQIPKSTENVIWSIDVTNTDVQDIHLYYNSAFIISDISDATKTQVWYIKEQYTIPVGKTVTISFCWAKAGDIGNYVKSWAQCAAGTYSATVILLGFYGDGTHYGQTIPFEAIKVT